MRTLVIFARLLPLVVSLLRDRRRWLFAGPPAPLMITLAVVVLTLGLFYWYNGLVAVHFFIATALGIGCAVMLTAALMGLVFLSSGTGHDESVADLDPDQEDGRNR